MGLGRGGLKNIKKLNWLESGHTFASVCRYDFFKDREESSVTFLWGDGAGSSKGGTDKNTVLCLCLEGAVLAFSLAWNSVFTG